MLFDYETLKFIWWLIIGILLIGFAIMDGHDMGVCSLLPFVGKTDKERRVVINTIGAHWEGNQVWFITAGGAIFAALPLLYATAFSGFYWALMAALWALFFRPVGFKYRSMVKDERWRTAWDWGLFIGSFVPALIFGVAFGNLFLGVPFGFDNQLVSTYTGSFWGLLSPFALLCGLVSAFMMITQGGVYLAHRTVDDIQARTKKLTTISAVIMSVLFVLAGFWVANLDGYVITSSVDKNALIDPASKTVITEQGAWLANFKANGALWAFPALGVIMPIVAVLVMKAGRTLTAFVLSSVGVLGVIMTAGVALFPFYMPSSSDPRSSLTVWDSTSSQFTLMVMVYVVVFILPVVVGYTSWAYAIMRGKVTKAYIKENEHTLY
ncbi:cytochrome d ubiquinol oxidase subunit II [Moraxella sp. K127]|uniref:Cytochrome d ubiquinol oxidase subunit II n=1 Tax=Moraxella lacunata TaxID=477 RepID=A0A1B8PXI7_MORLA|nr:MULTISPECIES: cytochrome d ubiquinol oxidase subunit II [Moraxella]MBE9579185.1 cytochrome d ubiquinol oxidase subunit II [Moraxella sp. K1664]MBE9591625.1 cytochrome d ubiquinol oxidase subunit II [Moraxella sp. K127]MDH9219163.1 cytochrome d ubiquinol oxidase subunit II [Moraxella lacunata]MDI4483866.1 cytochrome d ubiquinol oxidase subunit II [Moraxella lacunata]MDI4508299.1 cytochrome d ubiquinol oxidase subunit II [Moraxella lacunata]